LEWLLKHGKDLDYLLDLAAENPDDIPAPLLTQPSLPETTSHMLQAFLDLSEGRTGGFSGPNPISASDILAYFWIHPIGDARRFFALVRMLDRVFLAWASKK
jgi:hypothetical protein